MPATMPLDRLLQGQGFGSRRECRGLVGAGRVHVEGEVVDDPDADYPTEGLRFTVDGVDWIWHGKAYLALNKPAGYEVSQKTHHHPSVYSLLPVPLRERGVQAVGRLDADTTGLLLLSDDGQFIHTYSSPKKKVPKIYEVTTAAAVEAKQIEALLAGVQLHDEPDPIAAAACEQSGEFALRLTVTEGKYHLVKRMVAAAGNHVEALHRSRIGGFPLPAALLPGQWMWLEAGDLAALAEGR